MSTSDRVKALLDRTQKIKADVKPIQSVQPVRQVPSTFANKSPVTYNTIPSPNSSPKRLFGFQAPKIVPRVSVDKSSMGSPSSTTPKSSHTPNSFTPRGTSTPKRKTAPKLPSSPQSRSRSLPKSNRTPKQATPKVPSSPRVLPKTIKKSSNSNSFSKTTKNTNLDPRKAKLALALVTEILEVHNEVEENIKKFEIREGQLLNSLTEVFKSKPKPELSAEEKYRKKAEKVLKLVQDQALLMDKKMADLQRENAEMRRVIEESQGKSTIHSDSFAMLPSVNSREESISEASRRTDEIHNYSSNIDFELVDVYSKTEKAPSKENDLELLAVLAKRLMHEHMQKLLTEKQTGQMLDQEQKTIQALTERKQALLDGLKRSEASHNASEIPKESSELADKTDANPSKSYKSQLIHHISRIYEREEVEELKEALGDHSNEIVEEITVMSSETTKTIEPTKIETSDPLIVSDQSPTKPSEVPILNTPESIEHLQSYYQSTFPESNAVAVGLLSSIYSNASSRISS